MKPLLDNYLAPPDDRWQLTLVTAKSHLKKSLPPILQMYIELYSQEVYNKVVAVSAIIAIYFFPFRI